MRLLRGIHHKSSLENSQMLDIDGVGNSMLESAFIHRVSKCGSSESEITTATTTRQPSAAWRSCRKDNVACPSKPPLDAFSDIYAVSFSDPKICDRFVHRK
jgi:hypothetical protein